MIRGQVTGTALAAVQSAHPSRQTSVPAGRPPIRSASPSASSVIGPTGC